MTLPVNQSHKGKVQVKCPVNRSRTQTRDLLLESGLVRHLIFTPSVQKPRSGTHKNGGEAGFSTGTSGSAICLLNEIGYEVSFFLISGGGGAGGGTGVVLNKTIGLTKTMPPL
jgi:hypothetical protein